MTTVAIAPAGEVVAWKCGPAQTITRLRAALNTAGLDPNMAKDMLARNAMSRALTAMKEGRVISTVDETDAMMTFQFNQKIKTGSGIDFPRECVVHLDKSTGTVTGSDPQVVAAAQAELNKQIDTRTTADLSRLIQRIFEKHKGDLIKIRPGGGTYLVMNHDKHLADSVAILLQETGGLLLRFEIQPGGGATASSIADSVTDHFQGLLDELKAQVDGVDMNAPAAVIHRRTEAIRVLQMKLSAYSSILQDNAKTIGSELATIENDYLEAVGLKEPEPIPEPKPGKASKAPAHDLPPEPDPLLALMQS